MRVAGVLVVSAIMLIFSGMKLQAQTAWFINAAEAKAYAIEHKVPVMMVFAGSDWCKPCMMLKKEVLHSTEFTTYFPSKMALLYLDFPIQSKNKLPADLKKQNELLAEKYNQGGSFPKVIMIDTEGKVLAEISYTHQTPAVFIEQCEAVITKMSSN